MTATENLALPAVSRDDAVGFLRSLVEEYSPSGHEAGTARVLEKELRKHGISPRRDKVGNIIGEAGNGDSRILLCGHMDTVPGKLDVRTDYETIYGRGVVDAKASLAALTLGGISAVRNLSDDVHITIVGVVEEETSTSGVKSLIKDHPPFDYAVFGEPSGSRNVTVGYKGHLRAGFDFTTIGGHSASPWLSRNSFDEAVRFWNMLESELFDNGNPSKFQSLTGSVTHMMAGDDTNTIPRSASLHVDIRVPPSLTLEDVIERVESLSEAYESRTNSEARVDVTFRNKCPPVLTGNESASARAFGMAVRRVTGEQAVFVKKTGTSDMNVLAESYKIPMVAYGPGDSSLDHTDNEHISITEYLESIEICTQAIGNLARFRSGKPQLILHAGLKGAS